MHLTKSSATILILAKNGVRQRHPNHTTAPAFPDETAPPIDIYRANVAFHDFQI